MVKDMATKTGEIKEMMLDIPQKIVAYDGNPAGQHLYGEQREQIAETLYKAGYRKVDEFAECRDCPAWSGSDCTRHTYDESCLKDETDMRKQIIEKFSEMLIEDFIRSVDNQELSTVKGVLKNVCPAKVNKIKKRILRSIEND